MNVYKFETLNEFGYAKDPRSVFMIVRDELRSIYSYAVTDGYNEVPRSEFKAYPVWADHLNDDGEIYYELYGKRRVDDKDEMLGIIKIEKLTTID